MTDSPANPDDDDAELELEPVDPEILAHQRQRAQHKADAAAAKIDVVEIFGESSNYSDLSVDWESWRQFRFTTRHLMMLTAILAVVLALAKSIGHCLAVTVVGVVALIAGWIWVIRLERRQDAERARRREEFMASMRKSPGQQPAGDEPAAAAEPAAPPPVLGPRFQIKFAFSMKELMVATTVAAVAIGLLVSIGPENLALVLGVVALAGLIVNAVGLEPPRMVILTWWLLMVMYLAVGVGAALLGRG